MKIKCSYSEKACFTENKIYTVTEGILKDNNNSRWKFTNLEKWNSHNNKSCAKYPVFFEEITEILPHTHTKTAFDTFTTSVPCVPSIKRIDEAVKSLNFNFGYAKSTQEIYDNLKYARAVKVQKCTHSTDLKLVQPFTNTDLINNLARYFNESKQKTMLDNLKKLGGKEMKVLEIYKERMENKYEDQYSKNFVEIREHDDNVKQAINIENQAKSLVEKISEERKEKSPYIIYIDYCPEELFTEKSKKEKADADMLFKNQMSKLDNLIQEVKARLELTNSSEEQVDVLKTYGILDKNGKVNV